MCKPLDRLIQLRTVLFDCSPLFILFLPVKYFPCQITNTVGHLREYMKIRTCLNDLYYINIKIVVWWDTAITACLSGITVRRSIVPDHIEKLALQLYHGHTSFYKQGVVNAYQISIVNSIYWPIVINSCAHKNASRSKATVMM